MRITNLTRRAASTRARLVWRLKRGKDSRSELLRPAVMGVGVAGLVFLGFGTPWGALAAGGWTFAIALVLALRSAQHRHELAVLAVQHELYDLRQLLPEVHELRQQLRVTQALIQVEEIEDVEEIDPHDEPTRAVQRPAPSKPSWRQRFGLHWPASR